jgi:erythromycin esterase-like protein
MLSRFLFITLLINNSTLFAQQFQLRNDEIHPIKTTSSLEEDFGDLQFLKEVWKDKRIILLGEQSHGDGATFEAKVRLIKFLRKEMGFDLLSFESGFYENYKAYQQVKVTEFPQSPLKQSISSIWSQTKEFEPLLKYVHEASQSANPLLVAGFDCQEEDLFQEGYLNEVKKLFEENDINLNDNIFLPLEEVILGDCEFIATNKEDSLIFFSAADQINSSFAKITKSAPTQRVAYLQQAFTSWLALIRYSMDEIIEKPIKVQNPRDLQMARNLIFLSEMYPDKKIIAWGASYHFANHIERYKNTELTKTFSHKLDSIYKAKEPSDLDSALQGAFPMGKILKDHFGNSVYSLAFSSFKGEFGMLGFESTPLQPIQPPKESIEYELSSKSIPLAFVDYQNRKDNSEFYSSVLGNLPLLAPWPAIFDGLFFIENSHTPTFPTTVTNDNSIQSSLIGNSKINFNNQTEAIVIDNQTKQGIPYASISIINTARGLATNSEGKFVLNLKGIKSDERIVLSSIGYESDTLTYKELKTKKIIELKPKTYLLSAVQVRSKPLTAKEIIKQAERRISKNYHQGAYNQELFYRVKKFKNDSIEFNEESSILLFNQNGYQASSKYGKNFFGKILQYRNTTQNPMKDKWGGVGSLWLMYSHNAVLDKANVLHRVGYYNIAISNITEFQNRMVYEITFDCKKPGAYTTGFGYPAPLTAKGKIYIDVEDFAVLKFEVLIQRKPYTSKRRKNIVLDPYGVYLVQNYQKADNNYFLNYSKQVFFDKWNNVKNNSSFKEIEIREMLSTDIQTKNIVPMTQSIMNIKGSSTVVFDELFWQNHSIITEDQVSSYATFFDKK